ncbi:MAG: adenylyltransferase/cytidyltransferase family protein, partial [Cetobacterium sp.]
MKLALYSGTFDPITKGHREIIKRASKMCDKLIVAVLNNSAKKTLFSLDERKEMVKEVLKDIQNIEVIEH